MNDPDTPIKPEVSWDCTHFPEGLVLGTSGSQPTMSTYSGDNCTIYDPKNPNSLLFGFEQMSSASYNNVHPDWVDQQGGQLQSDFSGKIPLCDDGPTVPGVIRMPCYAACYTRTGFRPGTNRSLVVATRTQTNPDGSLAPGSAVLPATFHIRQISEDGIGTPTDWCVWLSKSDEKAYPPSLPGDDNQLRSEIIADNIARVLYKNPHTGAYRMVTIDYNDAIPNAGMTNDGIPMCFVRSVAISDDFTLPSAGVSNESNGGNQHLKRGRGK